MSVLLRQINRGGNAPFITVNTRHVFVSLGSTIRRYVRFRVRGGRIEDRSEKSGPRPKWVNKAILKPRVVDPTAESLVSTLARVFGQPGNYVWEQPLRDPPWRFINAPLSRHVFATSSIINFTFYLEAFMLRHVSACDLFIFKNKISG